MLQRNPMLFIRGDEAEEAWRIIDPVMAAWAAGDVPMEEYAAGAAPRAPRSDAFANVSRTLSRTPRFQRNGPTRSAPNDA